VIPSTVQILCSSCFSSCKSLSSISFDYPSPLTRIESKAFAGLDLIVIIPSTVLFVAFDAIPTPYQISIADCDFCPEFDRWQHLRVCGISVDFRRILRIDSEFGSLNDYLISDSIFEEESIFGVFDRISNEIYRRCEDGSSLIIKQLNLSHPCILATIGFFWGTNSTVSREFAVRRDFRESSVADGNSQSESNCRNCSRSSICTKLMDFYPIGHDVDEREKVPVCCQIKNGHLIEMFVDLHRFCLKSLSAILQYGQDLYMIKRFLAGTFQYLFQRNAENRSAINSA
jgi:hypothetical protein